MTASGIDAIVKPVSPLWRCHRTVAAASTQNRQPQGKTDETFVVDPFGSLVLVATAFILRQALAPPPVLPPQPHGAPPPPAPAAPPAIPARPAAPAGRRRAAPAAAAAAARNSPLDESDGRLQELLGRLLPGQPLVRFFRLDHFVRRFVLLIDSLPRNQLPVDRLPVKPVAGKFLVTGSGDQLTIAPANFRRYTPWISLAEATDPKLVVAVYVHFYPLFQKAYRDLGYPTGYFNDRLIEAIDDLLDTPEPSGPLQLVQPEIVHLYADVELEARSAGQKILLRIGPNNAARVKALLRDYRRELVAATVPAAH